MSLAASVSKPNRVCLIATKSTSIYVGAPLLVLRGPAAPCRSDASKLCAEHIGKPPQMNACLKENKAKLSDYCRKVVEARGG